MSTFQIFPDRDASIIVVSASSRLNGFARVKENAP